MTQTLEPTPAEIAKQCLYLDMGLTETEYESIVNIIGRQPNYTETGIFAVMWSEHCSYKTSKPLLKKFSSHGPQVIQGPGEGAGIVDIGDGQGIVFKIESHNSPSAIEPYQGAATGVGGIMRDIFSMGAKPIAALNSLRFGRLNTERTKYLFKEVVRGIAGYGNRLGVPTVGGEIQFDDCYEGNPLVNAMGVGLIVQKDIQKGMATGAGNTVIYVGAKTGRDGIHGATFSSIELSEDDQGQGSDIQAGDPFLEKLFVYACLEVIESDALIGMQDMGAAGLTSSASEMASKAGMGLELNLNLVPQREENMTAYEMMLSESQERMLLVVKQGQEQEIFDLFEKYDLEAVAIGQVTDDKHFRLLHNGKIVCDIPVDPLAEDAPTYYKEAKVPAYYQEFQELPDYYPEVTDFEQTLTALLQQPTIASKRSVYQQFDSTAQVNTVVGPGSDAAVIQIRGYDKAIALSTDCNSRYLYLDPEVGGQIAVAEAARNIVASGAKPLALTDGLNFGSPDKPENYWAMEKSVEGMAKASVVLDTPVVSGNVSLYNEKAGRPIYPTPIVGMVGLHRSLDDITTMQFKERDDVILLVGETKPEFGGSELQNLLEESYFGKAPKLDLTVEKNRQNQILTAIQVGWIESAHDLSEGGLAVALAESLFGTKPLGAEINLSGDPRTLLFSESQSRFLLTVKPHNVEDVLEQIDEAMIIGHVTDDQKLQVTVDEETVIHQSVERLEDLWEGAIPCLLNLED